MTKKIIIADDHPLFRSAISLAISQAVEQSNLYEAGTISELQNLLEEVQSPDLILLDLQMPGAHGLSGLIYLRGQYPNTPLAVVSSTEDTEIIQQTLQRGANGFIPKSEPIENMKEAIKIIMAGEKWLPDNLDLPDPTEPKDIESKLASLTPQQFRVLGMISEGLLNKQIAYDLNVSEATIKAHVTAIFKKLGVRSRTQAVIAVKELEVNTNTPDKPET